MLAWPVTRGDLKVSCSTLAAKNLMRRVARSPKAPANRRWPHKEIKRGFILQLAKGVALEDWLAVEGVLKGVESPTARSGDRRGQNVAKEEGVGLASRHRGLARDVVRDVAIVTQEDLLHAE